MEFIVQTILIYQLVSIALFCLLYDLSAMAAKPYCIFISITLNKNNISKIIKDLKHGFGKALRRTRTFLAGGDLCIFKSCIIFRTVIREGLKTYYIDEEQA